MSWVLSRGNYRWSFLPSNLETFELLQKNVGVDHIVLPARSIGS
jgi:hypothetical protein